MSEILTGQQQWEKFQEAARCVEHGQILTRAQFTALMDMAGECAGRPIDGINEGEVAYNALHDAHYAALERERVLREALEAYADPDCWDSTGFYPNGTSGADRGEHARAALAAVATPQGQEVGDEV